MCRLLPGGEGDVDVFIFEDNDDDEEVLAGNRDDSPIFTPVVDDPMLASPLETLNILYSDKKKCVKV